ncbi:MAG: bifunctional glutamate N-acetyltransferase/amino-acid acetyltransferase ArgJ [Clostridia bacterium]|nr:bifunctional glutamate N-acetyltransferase/amino-acid acetyltransferase ArgJ [Clostridia bacterium]
MKYLVKKNGGITTPQGFKAGVAQTEVKYRGRYDLALVVSECPAVGAGVFTTNKFPAAPVQVSRQHLAQSEKMRGFVVNSGCANACTGKEGLAAAYKMAEFAGEVTGYQAEEFFVASTGVIGNFLPLDKVKQGIKEAGHNLSPRTGTLAAQAIMTTDTVPKEVALEVEIEGKQVVIGAMAKGSGMIHPNMATMLGFITTDVAITKECLQKALVMANEDSFNMVTVDGDTSTNDTLVALANGQAGNAVIANPVSEAFQVFVTALKKVCIFLAKMIAQDGEGATKLIEVNVVNAASREDARQAARIIAGSNLFKATIFGEDANWGRIVCALGYSGTEFIPENVVVYLDDLLMVENGSGVDFDEAKAGRILGKEKIVITVDLQAGEFTGTAWGCDLSYEYVKINADYRS